MDLTEELQQLGLLEGSLRQAGTTGGAVVMIPPFEASISNADTSVV